MSQTLPRHRLASQHLPELQQEAGKEASRYIRHSGRSTPGAPPNPKDTAIHETIKDHYAQIEQLADEKLVLAQRVIDLIARARARLDHDLSRVLVQQGEDPNAAVVSAISSVSVPRRNVLEVKETVRTPREATPVPLVVSAPPQVAGNKSKVFPSKLLLCLYLPHAQGDELLEVPRPVRPVMAVPHLPQGTPELELSVLPASPLQSTTKALDNHLCLVDRRPRRKPMKMARVKKTTGTKKTRTCTVSVRSSRMER
jgi:hypothetical protein